MSLADSLDRLVAEHDRIGSPLREQLAPGTPRSDAIPRIESRGLSPPDELVQLFEWHGYRAAQGSDGPVAWFWPAVPLSFHDAVARYDDAIRLGGIAIGEYERIASNIDPVATVTGFWRQDWFPILRGSPEEYAAECPIDGPAAEAPVWRVNWHPDAGFETVRLAPSLVVFVDRVVDLFRAGAYEWSEEHHAIAPVERVFEERGLGAMLRP
jgi:hypothetical protein